MSNLYRALTIAFEAHAGQVDKGGKPYIDHPLRVMMAQDPDDEPAKIVAVLHDVVEDCPTWTLERLRREGFGLEVLSALALVTKPPVGTNDPREYLSYIKRISRYPLAAKVKLADLRDNADLTRLGREPSAWDITRNKKYVAAICILEDALFRSQD